MIKYMIAVVFCKQKKKSGVTAGQSLFFSAIYPLHFTLLKEGGCN